MMAMGPHVDISSIQPLKFNGVIDADGHVLEPPDIWLDYTEKAFADRAIRVETNSDGLEVLMFDNTPARYLAPGYLATLGMMGETDAAQHKPDPSHTYLTNIPFGAMDPKERVRLLAAEGMEAAILYPTLGLLWEAEVKDIELSQAYCRAYNRWIVDFCADFNGGLIPVAHLSLGDPQAAAEELKRAVKAGCRGAFVAPFTLTSRAHGDSCHDPVFEVAQDLDVPFAIHPTIEPGLLRSRRFDASDRTGRNMVFFTNAGDGVRHALSSMFAFGAFSRFPKLKFVALESGAGWIGYWLDRMDSLFEKTFHGNTYADSRKPSEVFREQCYISADPFETTIGGLIELVGADRFFWATDYPHADHPASYLRDIEHLVDDLPQHTRAGILGANVRKTFGLG